MGIDYGRKRVGLAVTDPLHLFGQALTTVANHEAIRYIVDYHLKDPIETFVLGYPRNMDYRPSEILPEVEAFEKNLHKALPHIPIIRTDERFTSQIALRTLREAGIKKMARRDKATVDKISAVLILQTYLEQKTPL